MDMMIVIGDLSGRGTANGPQLHEQTSGLMATYAPFVLTNTSSVAYLCAIDDGQLNDITRALDAMYGHGSDARCTWRMLGPLNVIVTGSHTQPAASQPSAASSGVLGIEPKPPTDLPTPPRNTTGFAS